jgi:hypothetical protein
MSHFTQPTCASKSAGNESAKSRGKSALRYQCHPYGALEIRAAVRLAAFFKHPHRCRATMAEAANGIPSYHLQPQACGAFLSKA